MTVARLPVNANGMERPGLRNSHDRVSNITVVGFIAGGISLTVRLKRKRNGVSVARSKLTSTRKVESLIFSVGRGP